MRKEENEHNQVCQWLRYQYPNIIFNTDLSGIKLSMGAAVKAAKLRSNKGFPDIVIYEKKGGFGACFIELKRTGEKLFKKDGKTYKTEHLEEQANMIIKLVNNGYYANFAIGFEDAKKQIDEYLAL